MSVAYTWQKQNFHDQSVQSNQQLVCSLFRQIMSSFCIHISQLELFSVAVQAGLNSSDKHFLQQGSYNSINSPTNQFYKFHTIRRRDKVRI